MSMWLVFWSEHVCKRCDPTLSSERRAEWLGQRRHSHNYTAPSKWFQHFQRVSKLYFQLAAAFVRLVRHHMNALWLSVTSRETKTKCLHRERTVKLGKKKKKKVKHILWLRCIHRETHRRTEISSSPLFTMDFCWRKRRSALWLRESERLIHEVRGVDIKPRPSLIVMFHPQE